VVTNLPPDAVAQYKKVVESKSKAEKLKNLRIFASLVPEHKGTEKLRANIKRRIVKLEEGMEKERVRKRQSRRQRTLSTSKGKDELLLLLFHPNPELKFRFLSRILNTSSTDLYMDAVRPYSSRIGGVNTVFLPMNFSLATSSDYSDLVRQADGALFAASSQEDLHGCGDLINSFKKQGIYFTCPGSEVRLVRSSARGADVTGHSDLLSRDEAIEYLSQMKVEGAAVELSRLSTRYSLESISARNPTLIRFWVMLDDEARGAPEQEIVLLNQIIPAIIKRLSEVADNPAALVEDVLSGIGKIRVRTKEPREKEVPEEPVLLKEGATVLDLAKSIHGELAAELKYAMVYRQSEQARSMRVGTGFKLKDGDIVEIH